MHCDCPQRGSFTIPGRAFSGLTAFGLFGERVGNDLIPDSIFLHPSLPSPFQQNNNCSVWHCVSRCLLFLRLPTNRGGPLLGETKKSHTPFPWSLEDDACFMLSGLKYIYIISGFLQHIPSMILWKNFENILWKVKSKGQLFLVFILLPHTQLLRCYAEIVWIVWDSSLSSHAVVLTSSQFTFSPLSWQASHSFRT